MWDEATRIAASVLFKAGVGLRAWPWYEAELERIVEVVGRDDMMHEATCEAFRLLHAGLDGRQVFRETEAYLRGLWRPRFDRSKATYEPRLLPLEAIVEGSSRQLYEQEEQIGEVRLRRIVDSVKAAMTAREWQLVVSYANGGSMRDVGDTHGVSHMAVKRALTKARKLARYTAGV